MKKKIKEESNKKKSMIAQVETKSFQNLFFVYFVKF